jgi:hypothetical protein
MNSKDFRKRLKQAIPHLRKPLFGGDPIRLFDEEYAFDIPSGKLERMVQIAMDNLYVQGLEPSEDYAKNGGDCDKWVLLIRAEVQKQWMNEHAHLNSYPAIPLGRWIANGHALVFGLTENDGLQVWNYGTLTQWEIKNCIEVEI